MRDIHSMPSPWPFLAAPFKSIHGWTIEERIGFQELTDFTRTVRSRTWRPAHSSFIHLKLGFSSSFPPIDPKVPAINTFKHARKGLARRMHPWVLEVSPVEETTCKEVRGQLADYRKHRVKHPEKGRIER